MSYLQTYYHIVFSTKRRTHVLKPEKRRELYNYLFGTLKKKKSHVYRIGGTTDHLHMLISLHQSVRLDYLIRDMKTSMTTWIKRENIYRNFPGWQTEYGGFTHSYAEKNRLIEYIAGQEEHHKHELFLEEFKRLLREHGIDFEERYLE